MTRLDGPIEHAYAHPRYRWFDGDRLGGREAARARLTVARVAYLEAQRQACDALARQLFNGTALARPTRVWRWIFGEPSVDRRWWNGARWK